MNANTSTCPKCQQEIAHGQYPFCPHGEVRTMSVIGDEVPGGARYFHNLGDQPIWIESRADLKREMDKRGLVHADRNSYAKDDKSPWATRTRLRPGQTDPFLGR